MQIISDSIRRARPLLGTFVEIAVAGADAAEMQLAVNAAFEAIAEVHRLMSCHEPHSDVSRLNREAGVRPVKVDAWTFQVLQAAVEMHRRSNGGFDVSVAPTLQNRGLLRRRSDDAPIAPDARWFDAIELLAGRGIRFRHPDVRIDLGGIAKGFAVDRALEILRDFDIPRGLVNAGGDLAALGSGPQTIHIRDPRDPRAVICSVAVSDEALASTAHRFDPFRSAETTGSAIIDPATGKPVRAIVGATVRAPSCMVADALTKIVIISQADAPALLEHYQASALSVSAAGDILVTPGWHHAVYRAA